MNDPSKGIDMNITLDERPHALYRFFGAGGTLLYIGITADLPTRLTSHRDEKAWWLGVTSVTVEHYPNRTSVLEAERRAIITEKPLYNAQHNAPARNVEPKPRPASSSAIVPVCVECKIEIPRGDKGVVHLAMRQAYIRLAALQQEDERERLERAADPMGVRVIPMSDLMRRYDEMPAEAAWTVHCDGCNPHFDQDNRSWCDGCYWFSVDRCRTWPNLVEWTCHLSGKNWFRATNWMKFIRTVAHNTSKVGLVGSERATA